MRAIQKAAVAVLLTVLVAAPQVASASSRAYTAGHSSFVGSVRGTDAFVAIVVRGSHVTAYVCDSKRIAQWFTGSALAGSSTLTSKDGYVLRITIGSRQISGSLRLLGPAGVVHRFVAARDEKPGGLYRGEKSVAGKRYVGGWIILPDGRQRGEVVSGSTDIASPTLDPNDPTVQIKRGKKRPSSSSSRSSSADGHGEPGPVCRWAIGRRASRSGSTSTASLYRTSRRSTDRAASPRMHLPRSSSGGRPALPISAERSHGEGATASGVEE